jgi:very-short-patch-repair endonuclease
MTASSADAGPATASVLLDRHERRRGDGRPTVSVLVGPVGLAIEAVRGWAEGRGRGLVQGDVAGLAAAVASWADRIARGRDLRRDAVAWLSRHLGRDEGELGALVRAGTAPYERAMFLDAVLPGPSPSVMETVCRWLLEGPDDGGPIAADAMAAHLVSENPDGGGAQARVVSALLGLVPAGSDPVLLLAGRGDPTPEATALSEATARLLAEMAAANPRLTLVLAVAAGAFEAFDRLAPETRAKALVREGVIRVEGLGEDVIARRLCDDAPRLAGSIRRLSGDGASEALVARFREAVRKASAADRDDPVRDEEARSAAERFLFERLESLPQTAGLFRLNQALDVRFGTAAMEVDLLARDLRLAIEVDGYYHFRDADSYRRDRRKDFALQARGFLVVRVLADDVVARLEEVLNTVLAAVASRRGRPDDRGLIP